VLLTERPPLPRSFRADIPPELEQIALKAMAKNRDERFQSVEELAQALLPFSGIEGAPQMLRSFQPPMVVNTTPFTQSDKPKPPEPSTAESQPTSLTPADAGIAKLAVFAGGALAALGVGALVVVLLSRPGHESVSGPTELPAPPSQPAPAQPVVVPAAAASPPADTRAQDEVRVRIGATPADARIFLDGVEFPNPMDAFRPRSLEPLRIRVQARGHQTLEQLAIFDQDREIAFSLEPGSGKRQLKDERPSAQQAKQRADGKAPATVEARVTPKKPADAIEEKTVPPTPPDDDLYRGPTGNLRKEF
jgi:hypothetical protein